MKIFTITNFVAVAGIALVAIASPVKASYSIEKEAVTAAAEAVRVVQSVNFTLAFADFDQPTGRAIGKPTARPANLLSQVKAKPVSVGSVAIWIDRFDVVHIYDDRNPNRPVHTCTKHQIQVACPAA